MALDRLVDGTQLNTDLTTVANAIRAKTGTSGQLTFPSGFVSAIGGISVNQNHTETVTGTVANPWGGVNYTTLVNAIRENEASAIISIDATSLGIATPIFNHLLYNTSYQGLETNGASIVGSSMQAYVIVWNAQGGVQSAQMQQPGGALTDLSTYASVIPTSITIKWHP